MRSRNITKVVLGASLALVFGGAGTAMAAEDDDAVVVEEFAFEDYGEEFLADSDSDFVVYDDEDFDVLGGKFGGGKCPGKPDCKPVKPEKPCPGKPEMYNERPCWPGKPGRPPQNRPGKPSRPVKPAPSQPGRRHPTTGAETSLYAVGGGLLATTGGSLLVSQRRRRME